MGREQLEISKRKIRNGLRKQAIAIQKEREKVWERLNHVSRPDGIQITKQTIKSKPRKLRARWTVEVDQDLRSQYGIGTEDMVETVRNEFSKIKRTK